MYRTNTASGFSATLFYDKEKENIIHSMVFLAPAKMQNLKLQIARGLDEILEDKDRKQELFVCKFVVVNGIKYEDKRLKNELIFEKPCCSRVC